MKRITANLWVSLICLVLIVLMASGYLYAWDAMDHSTGTAVVGYGVLMAVTSFAVVIFGAMLLLRVFDTGLALYQAYQREQATRAEQAMFVKFADLSNP